MSIKQDDDTVQLTCQSKGGVGETSTFSAKYLVGCDGARSATRSHIAKEAGISEKGKYIFSQYFIDFMLVSSSRS